ncbi:hypothetical protein G7Z98_17005 [Pseudomonas stutzeri]|nr:hypothetical protein [Stutzerimonas stutzeri]
MGGIKEAYLESEEGRQETLANALGLSWDEVGQLDYEITQRISNEGLLYGYVVTFSGDSNPDVLAKIPGIDKYRSLTIAPWIFERSYEEDYALGAIAQNIDHRASFNSEMDSSVRLQEVIIDDHFTRQLLLRQIYISIIGALETILSDIFISKTLSSDWYLKEFVKTHPDFKSQKISVSEIFSFSQTIRERAKTVMVGVIYHKLPAVREMYTQTFSVKFPDIANLQKYILTRHDLVHRNGKTVDGKVVKINDNLVNDLRGAVVSFVDELYSSFEVLDDEDFPF